MDKIIIAVKNAILEAMELLESEKNSPGMLVISNAEYARIENNRTGILLDSLSELTGCTKGKTSLLGATTPYDSPLWFSIRNNSGTTVYTQWADGVFKNQLFEAAPETLLEYDNWQKIAQGIMGPDRLYTIGSIGSLWYRKVPWHILKGAELHGSACPGNFAGFLVHRYLQQNLPLKTGDHYLFVFAPPTCGMDILRLIYASTAGEKQMLSMQFPPEKMASYFSGDVVTFVTVIRINKIQDFAEGVVLGFNLQKACMDADVDMATFFPKGQRFNPLFGFSRAKVSHSLSMLNTTEQMGYISERKRFSGKAILAQQIASTGCDPYSIIMAEQNKTKHLHIPCI